MKKIIVIAKYEAYVPEDMTVSQVESLVEDEIRMLLDQFSVTVDDYKDEDDNSPMFDLKDVMVGTHSVISIGGD
jgi:type III secretory pathway lipoprotein EscJ